MSKKEKEQEWQNANVEQENKAQQQQQQKMLNPNDFVDVDDLIFEVGSKQTTLIGYQKMVKQIVTQLQKTQEELKELKAQYEKNTNVETFEKMKKKIDNLSIQNNDYRQKIDYYIKKNKELNDIIEELTEDEKEEEEKVKEPKGDPQIPRENSKENKSKDKK